MRKGRKSSLIITADDVYNKTFMEILFPGKKMKIGKVEYGKSFDPVLEIEILPVEEHSDESHNC